PEEWRWKTVVKVNEGVRRDPARIPIMGKTFEAAMREAAISAYRKYKESASPRSGTGTYYPRQSHKDSSLFLWESPATWYLAGHLAPVRRACSGGGQVLSHLTHRQKPDTLRACSRLWTRPCGNLAGQHFTAMCAERI